MRSTLPASLESTRAGWRQWGLLAVLTAALTLSYMDRYLIAVLIQPIKAAFQLSDTQIGLLTGFAFALVYGLLGVPIARIADRGARRAVIVGSIIAWSTMTALTGWSQSYLQLAFARFGVGIGEAGVYPSAQAIIAGSFPITKRTTALSIFSVGGSVGLLLAFSLGSWVNARIGWRETFLVMAAPGLLLAPLIPLFIRANTRDETSPVAGFGRSVRRVLGNPQIRQLALAESALCILLFGQSQWLPAFFERTFTINGTLLGSYLGFTQAFGAIVGVIAGGILGDRLQIKRRTGAIQLAGASIMAALVPSVLLYTTRNVAFAFLFATCSAFLFSMSSGPLIAHAQSCVHVSDRASAAAWVGTIASLLGLGGGPAIIGMASDAYARALNTDGLRYSLLTVVAGSIAWASLHLTLLRKSMRAQSVVAHASIT